MQKNKIMTRKKIIWTIVIIAIIILSIWAYNKYGKTVAITPSEERISASEAENALNRVLNY